MSDSHEVSWTTVVASGGRTKVIDVNQSRTSAFAVPQVIFVDADLKNALSIRKAIANIPQALNIIACLRSLINMNSIPTKRMYLLLPQYSGEVRY